MLQSDIREYLLSFKETSLCKRKTVHAVIFRRLVDGSLYVVTSRMNHPVHNNPEFCTGLVGRCGCVHAEVAAIFDLFEMRSDLLSMRHSLSLAVNYSPCTPCAHVIGQSRLFKEVIYLTTTEHDLQGLTTLTNYGISLLKVD